MSGGIFSPGLESMYLKQLHIFRKVFFRKSHIKDWVKSHLCFISKHFLYGLRVSIDRSWGFIFLCGVGGGGEGFLKGNCFLDRDSEGKRKTYLKIL